MKRSCRPRKLSFVALVYLLFVFWPPLALLAGDQAILSPQQRRGPARSTARVFKMRISPHWFADGSRFWYRNDLPDDTREYILVDAAAGKRQPAFDHERLAAALRQAGLAETIADRMALEDLQFPDGQNTLLFAAAGYNWQSDLATYALTKLGERPAAADSSSELVAPAWARASLRTGAETSITFVNRTAGIIELFWLDSGGQRQSYGKLPPGAERDQHTYAGHLWQVVDETGDLLATFLAQEEPARVEITGKIPPRRDQRQRPQRPPGPTGDRRDRPSRDQSPDGKWTAFVEDGNVFLRATDGQEDPIPLSRDGSADESYGLLEWSPDAKALVAFRVTPGDQKEVYLIESSPPDQGRARLHTRPYPQPGDRFDSYELNLFDVEQQQHIKPELDRIDFGQPRLRWNDDGRRFTYEKTDRGHQRFRLIEVDSRTGQTRTLIDEKTDTFIWTAHTENQPLRMVNWLAETPEIIYASERDGWRHLYLVNAETGRITNQITSGPYVVRAIDRIDEQRREIWFRASGRNPDQDPYLIHYYRIRFDGTGLLALTEGNGQHTVQYSPDREYLIDTYSRVDMAPVHELRRPADGRLVCPLERADISQLEESGWQPPEVFTAKGRDGQTDIWGIICRPADLDPARKYPILEDIYAGPQGSYVPKTFSPARRYAWLTDRGFVVVKIDGMGTANRSKAFHDVCWRNLKDAGLPDRICWIQAAARRYPYLDTDRVGIYGTSAGGQSAAGAVLFHPEFYKAAAAACGCHDNRLDKASWNEQWMGYPVGPHYADCSNVENAHRLGGKLLLIVGEMDTNVPPESTLRFVDALIKADKDFELLVIPGAGHGNGGAYGNRRLEEFFTRHLQ
ncbi:MAG: prolyl oligopeptidase family serine peptidase [Sedimentisphaerales bacterium]|nr:prolyl oligopeptidase family serine peptidase [Sedimentisphaerales bacterium]